jgi:hypothetical protein
MLRAEFSGLLNGSIHGLALEQGDGQRGPVCGFRFRGLALKHLNFRSALMGKADLAAVQTAYPVKDVQFVTFAHAQRSA